MEDKAASYAQISFQYAKVPKNSPIRHTLQADGLATCMSKKINMTHS